ncbi:DNA cytosine methyltransferase [Alteromonas portus]|uniref:DNA cytosine methyltransferase n=1 Tax=Alteromonas portus TaxID=2565549 RepID=UPI003BF78AFB
MLTYVSLFSSAGVGCFGLKELGFNCIVTAELLEKRLNIQKTNKKCKYETGYICGDLADENIHNQLYDEIAAYKAKENVKDIDLVVATPPCQGMSVANHKKNEELGRNSLVVESIRVVSEQKPKFFVFENVRAFLKSICTDLDGVDKSIEEAIFANLSAEYLIETKILNLKNYGSNSSRTRTLVIGVRSDQKGITPLDLFPSYRPEKTLREVIGNLPSLKNMGEFSEDDIFHSFRPYKEEMYPWIKATPYGKSAFDNESDSLKPHKIVNGEVVVNQNKNGDKYKRQLWERVAPCIHTRNDCLPSQNTVHPVDNRVFSIRELMLMMSIPNTFQWVPEDVVPKRSSSFEEKVKFRKKTEFNIRQCIGEAVPTGVMTEIGRNIQKLTAPSLGKKQVADLIDQHSLRDTKKLRSFIEKNWKKYTYQDMFKVCELANAKRLDTAAYYTDQEICFSAISRLPDLSSECVRILEPSVGVGSFLNQIIKKYQGKTLIIDCIDINRDSIELCQLLVEKYFKNLDVKFNFYNEDFLLWNTDKTYDIVIGNPPYMKVKNHELLVKYRTGVFNQVTNNIFSFFIEKCLKLGKFVSLIVPKALLNAPEYEKTRELLERYTLLHINDYNEKAFDVKIETVSITVKKEKAQRNNSLSIYSFLNKKFFVQQQKYIAHAYFNSWLLYRNEWFDAIFAKLEFGFFKVFRDRQITKQHTKDSGKYRVIKSRNIGHGDIKNIDGYDCFIDNLEPFAVKKFLDKNVLIVPNLTYNPRAARLPKGCVVDGSAAILYSCQEFKESDISYFSSDEFNKFYRIARNFGTRSMNIDSVSVKYFGVKR